MAGNGQEALNLLECIDYDLILMDCQMPELDGYATTKAIRSLDSAKARVAIIAMTANAMKEDRDRCLEIGMDDYLSKPIRKEDLAQKLSEWSQKSLETQEQTAASLIDWDHIDEITDGNAEFRADLFTMFLDSMPEIMTALERAIADHDLAAISHNAHYI